LKCYRIDVFDGLGSAGLMRASWPMLRENESRHMQRPKID
jgi:hypothetical protein